MSRGTGEAGSVFPIAAGASSKDILGIQAGKAEFTNKQVDIESGSEWDLKLKGVAQRERVENLLWLDLEVKETRKLLLFKG